jgi:hypothetical protein
MSRVGFARARRAAVVAAGLATVLASCTGGSGSSAGSASTSGDPVAQARTLIEHASMADPASVEAVDNLRFTAAGDQAAAALLRSGASGDARWAATWVYASDPKDPAVLRPLLEDQDVAIRLMAAAGLVSVGDDSGFAAIEDALGDGTILAGSEPPTPAWRFADETLRKMVPDGAAAVPEPKAGATEPGSLKDDWSSWLLQHQASLTFDRADGTWSAG